ncbi:MAG: choice-of-anchor tandem repeat GloVer-containing protein [Bryobacteraceae bacterium]
MEQSYPYRLAGGANQSGTVFAYSQIGSFAQLYNFGNYKDDGIAPAANLFLGKGTLYGTTTEGGEHGWGTVFSLDLKTGHHLIQLRR